MNISTDFGWDSSWNMAEIEEKQRFRITKNNDFALATQGGAAWPKIKFYDMRYLIKCTWTFLPILVEIQVEIWQKLRKSKDSELRNSQRFCFGNPKLVQHDLRWNFKIWGTQSRVHQHFHQFWLRSMLKYGRYWGKEKTLSPTYELFGQYTHLKKRQKHL